MTKEELLAAANFATLAVIDTSVTTAGLANTAGTPYAAWVQVMPVPEERSIYLLLSRLSLHRQYLERNAAASLLVVDQHDANTASTALARATFVGEAKPVPKTDQLRDAWLERHPESALWIDFPDFSFFRFEWHRGRFVEGFGKIEDFDA